jgi:alkanesulfonate monooxygenase SsuD/methylene tetrahydromethanopterin reductase-like flavin-dependent oxidoreductase (luciferase family)
VRAGFSIDPDQGLSEADELQMIKLATDLGYSSAWTPSRADGAAFDRCLRWHAATGLPVGISAVPASGQPPEFYAERARRVYAETGGMFTLVVGSGQMAHAAEGMRAYLAELRRLLPAEQPLYVAALGPLMLRVGAEMADGVALNWASSAQVASSRHQMAAAAKQAGRPVPRIVEYVRTAVDPDPALARRTVAKAALRYALGVPVYRAHFERMGFADELRRVEQSGGEPGSAFIAAVGAAGAPGEVRAQFERLGEGLDLAIVRVLVTQQGDAKSARRALEECKPN